jgi:uncharacterized protein YhaN
MTNEDKVLTILGELSKNVATILEEQQAQRTDIRSLQRNVSDIKVDMASKDDLEKVKVELEDKIETAKIELKAEIAKNSKNHNTRLTNIEEHVGITDPTKH